MAKFYFYIRTRESFDPDCEASTTNVPTALTVLNAPVAAAAMAKRKRTKPLASFSCDDDTELSGMIYLKGKWP